MAEKITNKTILNGVVHEVTDDLKEMLIANPDVLEKWNGLTSLSRNEWICWVTIVRKDETRKEHLVRLREDVRKGKKRPCCWPGCPHRRDDAKK